MLSGGSRPDAGQKLDNPQLKKIKVCLKIDPMIKRYLDTRDSKNGTIESAIRRSRAFREWVKLNKE